MLNAVFLGLFAFFLILLFLFIRILACLLWVGYDLLGTVGTWSRIGSLVGCLVDPGESCGF